MKKTLSLIIASLILSTLILSSCSKPSDGEMIFVDGGEKHEKFDLEYYCNLDALDEAERETALNRYRYEFGIYQGEEMIPASGRNFSDNADGYQVADRVARDLDKKQELADYFDDYYASTPSKDNPEKYIDWKVNGLPQIYLAIKALNISKEDFIKANNEEMKYYLECKEEDHESKDGIQYFTSEEIELLYSGTENEIKEYFAGPYAIYNNGKVYNAGIYFFNTQPEDWLKEEIPVEKIRELFGKLEEEFLSREYPLTLGIWREEMMQRGALETYSFIIRLKEYEELLKAQ